MARFWFVFVTIFFYKSINADVIPDKSPRYFISSPNELKTYLGAFERCLGYGMYLAKIRTQKDMDDLLIILRENVTDDATPEEFWIEEFLVGGKFTHWERASKKKKPCVLFSYSASESTGLEDDDSCNHPKRFICENVPFESRSLLKWVKEKVDPKSENAALIVKFFTMLGNILANLKLNTARFIEKHLIAIGNTVIDASKRLNMDFIGVIADWFNKHVEETGIAYEKILLLIKNAADNSGVMLVTILENLKNIIKNILHNGVPEITEYVKKVGYRHSGGVSPNENSHYYISPENEKYTYSEHIDRCFDLGMEPLYIRSQEEADEVNAALQDVLEAEREFLWIGQSKGVATGKEERFYWFTSDWNTEINEAFWKDPGHRGPPCTFFIYTRHSYSWRLDYSSCGFKNRFICQGSVPFESRSLLKWVKEKVDPKNENAALIVRFIAWFTGMLAKINIRIAHAIENILVGIGNRVMAISDKIGLDFVSSIIGWINKHIVKAGDVYEKLILLIKDATQNAGIKTVTTLEDVKTILKNIWNNGLSEGLKPVIEKLKSLGYGKIDLSKSEAEELMDAVAESINNIESGFAPDLADDKEYVDEELNTWAKERKPEEEAETTEEARSL